MAIQWFPGHMHATRKAITERMKLGVDVVIELLDARLPASSCNPLLAELTAGKPTLKLLNKQDLADPVRTAEWLAFFNAQPGTQAFGLDNSMVAPAQRMIQSCRELAPNRGGMAKPMRALICGIPNVGKSTLINTLVGRKATKTGDEAGITKVEQKIVLEDDFYLFDTPGMLWPRISVDKSGYNLAASGAIGRNAYDEEDVAWDLLNYLKTHYAYELRARYKLTDEVETLQDEALLQAIGRKRGAVMSGGRVNMQKAAEVVLNDFRSAILGRVTLESPEEFSHWLTLAEQADAARDAKIAARRASRKQTPTRTPRPPALDDDSSD